MKIDLPGLLKERLPSGNYRYRVRVKGDKNRRIRIYVDPDHDDFMKYYRAARMGVRFFPDTPPPILTGYETTSETEFEKPHIDPLDDEHPPDNESTQQTPADIIDFASWQKSDES